MALSLTQPQLKGWLSRPQYPAMFITTKTNKERIWVCWVMGDTVYRTDGFVDGKLKEPLGHSYKGNTLRSGEQQAPLEAEKMWLKVFDRGYQPDQSDLTGQKIYQHVKAQKEANGGMNRGVKLFGTTEITTKTTAGKKSLDTRHRPMLAKKYKDWIKKKGQGESFNLTPPGKAITFPALVQAKVDGIRALPHLLKDGTVALESRNGNNFVHLNHLRKEIKRWLEYKKSTHLILDGEMYVHTLHRTENLPSTVPPEKRIKPEDLSKWTLKGLEELRKQAILWGMENTEETTKIELVDYLSTHVKEMKGVERYQFISEACKITRTNPHAHEALVQYWIFDIWDPTKTNLERHQILQDLFKDYDGAILKLVPTQRVENHHQIETLMEQWVGETSRRESYEFEGLMVRLSAAKYMSSTTHQSCLLKYKRFEDEEWEVCGAEPCVGGTQNGAIKWICRKTIKNKERKVVAKQTGDTEVSRKLYLDYQKKPELFIGKMVNIRFNDRTKDGVPRFPRATAFVEDK